MTEPKTDSTAPPSDIMQAAADFVNSGQPQQAEMINVFRGFCCGPGADISPGFESRARISGAIACVRHVTLFPRTGGAY